MKSARKEGRKAGEKVQEEAANWLEIVEEGLDWGTWEQTKMEKD